MDAKLLAQWSINVITTVFITLQLLRSIILKKGFSNETIKMYSLVFSFCVISNLILSDALPVSILANALFAIVGFAVGNKIAPSEPKKGNDTE
jgi:hypothetical protein